MNATDYDEVNTDKFGNIIGRISFRRPGRKVLFEGHMDHVDVEISRNGR